MIEWLEENQQILSPGDQRLHLAGLVVLRPAAAAQLQAAAQTQPDHQPGRRQGLGSLCLISNMSAEPVFINQLMVLIDTSKGTLEVDITDIRHGIEDDATPDLAIHQITHQGPLRTGDFVHIGTFQGMVRQVCETHGIALKGLCPVGDWHFHALEIRAAAFYGSERHPLGITRRFRLGDLSDPECALIPESP